MKQHRNTHRNNPTREELYRLYVDEFLSITKLAEMFGRGWYTVRNWFVSMDIDMRTKSEINMRGKHMLTPEELYKLYIIGGMSPKEIAHNSGVARSTVRNWLVKVGIPIRSISDAALRDKQKPTAQDLERMYVEENLSASAIADIVGVTICSVSKWLKDADIEKHPSARKDIRGKNRPSKTELYEMYEIKVMNAYEISDELGVCSTAVYRWLSEYGIKTRSLHEYRGENASNWRGGITPNLYCEKWTEEVREDVRNKFGRVCFICGKSEKENGQKLSVHHTNSGKMCMCAYSCELVPLCRSCHGKTNGDRFYWYSLIMCKLLLESSAQYTIIDLCI